MSNPKQTMTILFSVAGALLLIALAMVAYNAGTHRTAPAPGNQPVAAPSPVSNAAPPPRPEVLPEATNALAPALKQEDTSPARRKAAMEAAIELKPEWSFRVQEPRDWSEVKVAAGEVEGQWTRVLVFRWNGKRYDFVREEGLGGSKAPKPAKKPAPKGEPALTEEDLKDVPREYRPGEDTAREAALGGHPDWSGTVTRHNSDWTQATVRIGPTGGPPVSEIQLKWSRRLKLYEVAATKDATAP